MTSELQALRDRIEELEELLGLSASELPAHWKLRDTPRRILGLLLRRERMSYHGLSICLGRDVNYHCLAVHLVAIRKFLRPLGVEVQTIYGFGYLLSPQAKRTLRAVIAAEQIPAQDAVTRKAPPIERLTRPPTPSHAN